MEKLKIVARYLDGRVVKGYTQDFAPHKPSFHLFSQESSSPGEGILIALDDLKAVFFVKDFGGNPEYKERKHYNPDERPSGKVVEVTFTDGEVMVGSTLGYDRKRAGFFIFPADPQCNNLRVFAVAKAVRSIRNL